MMRGVTFPAWFGDVRLQRALLLLLTVATFLGATQAAYVWDDRPLVVDNLWLADGPSLLGAFGVDLWETANVSPADQHSGYYRPLFLWSLALDNAAHGLSSVGAHAQNLLWHLVAVTALHALLLRFFGSFSALLGALLFAVHPVQSEAVVWVAARSDLMAAAFGLAALVLLLAPQVDRRRLGWAGLLAFCAVLSKESAVLLPFLLLVLDLGSGGLRERSRYVALFVPLLAYLVLRSVVGVSGPSGPDWGAWLALGSSFPAVLGEYSQMLMWPDTLSVARDLETLGALHTARAVAVGTLFLALAAAIVWGTQRRWAIAGLGLALFTFIPCLAAIADKGLLGERYLYLPLAGLGVMLANTCRRHVTWGLFAVVFVGLSVQRTGDRLLDWRDEQTLWVATLQVTPGTFAEMSYGHALRAAEYNLAAHQRFRRSLEGQPPRHGACENVIGSALAANRLDLAITGAMMAEQRGCDSLDFHAYFAVCRAFAGQWALAEARALQGKGDSRGRSALVLAAAQIVSGRAQGYEDLKQFETRRFDAREQVATMLRKGDQPDLADRVLAMGAQP